MNPPPDDALLAPPPHSGHDPEFDRQAAELTEFLSPPPVRRRPALRRRGRLSAILFALTGLSTFFVGLDPGGVWHGAMRLLAPLILAGRLPHDWASLVLDGLVYSGCVMGILLAHEMGHFLQAVRHRVPATLPFFIPFPISPFGTMGAVIVQDGSRADRRQLFDIAVSGPLAGLAVALPILWYGVATAEVRTFAAGGTHYGDPLLLQWIVRLVHGPLGPGQDVLLNAPLFAGWVGIFITALNLLPVGQLDGGHILYTLIGRRARFVAFGVLAAAVGWMALTFQFNYVLIVILLLLFGPVHPPTADDTVPLGWGRRLLGWTTLAFIVVGFTPTPIVV